MINSNFFITTLITVGLAFIGYIVKYLNDVYIAKRKDRLERVNRQLKDLYGPLLSLTNSTNSAWVKFRSVHRDSTPGFFGDKNPPNESEKQVWRLWMTTVFFPINEKIYILITNNTDLIIEDYFPECFKDLCAHVNTYQPIIENWKQGNFEKHLSLINYPTEINNYAVDSFNVLKKQQKRLLQ